MPAYLFKQVGTNVYQDRFYHMSEAPSIGAVVKDEGGRKWRRVATKPLAAVDTKCDPYSAKDFVKVTNKPGTLGDLWDRSQEQSSKRAAKEGVDPIREAYYKDYSKKRKGKRHPEQQKEQSVKNLAKQGITVDWGTD